MKINDRKKHVPLRDHKINDEIRTKIVFLILESGEKIGNTPIIDALNRAYDNNLDLVQIALNNDIPVCKIMDYGKFCFEQKKIKKNAKKESRGNEKKIIQLNPAMGENDFKIKLDKSLEFLKDGYKVNIIVKLKGRQVDYPEIVMDMMNRCIEICKDISKIESSPKLEGKRCNLFLTPII